MFKNSDKLRKILLILFPESIFYIFGSYARGTQTETSDIDLAIDAGQQLTSLELQQARNIIEALNIPQKIDLVDINRVPVEMKAIILKEGRIWSE